jgi:hypothetical protein
MARGESGRIVLEIEPSDKEQLHSAVRKDGLTLKEWFVQQMHSYLHGARETTTNPKPKQRPRAGRKRLARSEGNKATR